MQINIFIANNTEITNLNNQILNTGIIVKKLRLSIFGK